MLTLHIQFATVDYYYYYFMYFHIIRLLLLLYISTYEHKNTGVCKMPDGQHWGALVHLTLLLTIYPPHP